VLIDSSLAGVSGDKILSAMADIISDTKILEDSISKALAATGAFRGKVGFDVADSHGVSGRKLSADLKGVPLDPKGMREALSRASRAAGLGLWGRSKAEKCLELLLSSEREIHGNEHIHEIGEADTLMDIVGTMKAIQMLGLEGADYFATPIAVGTGSIDSVHGRLPVPAPATLAILSKSQMRITGTSYLGELTTPTGAALLAVLTGGQREVPPIRVQKVGTGIGEREIGIPNITRVLISSERSHECIKMLETNVDDVSGEVIGWLIERLQGSVEDVAVLPMVTKKNRPGFTIRAVVKADQLETAMEILLKETGTLGVKVFDCQRVKVDWSLVSRTIRIRGKNRKVGFKVSGQNSRMKPEYEDLKDIATQEGLSLRETIEEASRQVRQK
jgi:hypothetical protein